MQNIFALMKKILAFTFLFVLATATFAQDKGFYYGTRFSLGESDLLGGQLENTTGKLFWQVGAASAYQFTENIGLTADFLLSGKGTKNNDEVTSSGGVFGDRTYKYDEKVSLLSGDVPIAMKFSVNIQKLYLKVYGGPSVNFQFAGFHTREYEDANYNDENGFDNKEITSLETMNLGWVYGAGVDVKSGDGRLFFLDFRLGNSPKSIASINGKGVRNSYMGLSAGYLFH
ncbi:MAG: hypothetical protein ACI9BJ_000931 [Flavobacteriales bacterium]